MLSIWVDRRGPDPVVSGLPAQAVRHEHADGFGTICVSGSGVRPCVSVVVEDGVDDGVTLVRRGGHVRVALREEDRGAGAFYCMYTSENFAVMMAGIVADKSPENPLQDNASGCPLDSSVWPQKEPQAVCGFELDCCRNATRFRVYFERRDSFTSQVDPMLLGEWRFREFLDWLPGEPYCPNPYDLSCSLLCCAGVYRSNQIRQ